MQEGKPGAYYSKNLNGAPINYATIDQEPPCVVGTLCEFCSMLHGAEQQHAHTDHKNIIYSGDSSKHHLHWISYVDEYGHELHYLEGPQIIIDDSFSRLLHSDVLSTLVGKKAANVASYSESNNKNDSLYSSLLMDFSPGRYYLSCQSLGQKKARYSS
jgi:hypothetical protein